uniref:Uncharacterized protein n=1 Tax=Arundo donax TaxID=35708 RepID=A0A0A9AMH8_ARUDO
MMTTNSYLLHTCDDDDEFILAAHLLAHNQSQLLNAPRHGGSVVGHQVVHRDIVECHLRLYKDYF